MSTKKEYALPPTITRRDFVNTALLGSGYSLLATSAPALANASGQGQAFSLPDSGWYGYGGIGDYRLSHGNTPEAVNTAHDIRDGRFERLRQPESGETHDLVIVGAGMAGLGAALEYSKRRGRGHSCLMLDNHPVFGGEAKENEFEVNGTTLLAPQGANGFSVPPPPETRDRDDLSWSQRRVDDDARYYAELGIPRDLPYEDWASDLDPLAMCQDNYAYLVRGLQDFTSTGHFFAAEGGRWALDMWSKRLAETPLPDAVKKDLLTWYRSGRVRNFDSDEAARRFLDSMSYEAFLTRELGLSSSAARYADLFLASAAGLGSDAVSAYAASAMPMPGFMEPPGENFERHSFPGGNSGFARWFLKSILPDAIEGGKNLDDIVTGRIDFDALDRPGQALRMRLASTVVSVRHRGGMDGRRVEVVYKRGGNLHKVTARAVVMATGAWINRHVVRDLPGEYRHACSQFRHAPFLVVNVALTNWRFMHRLGMSAAIWDSRDAAFGSTCNIRRPMSVGRHRPRLSPDCPAVLTFYAPFHMPGLSIEAQCARGRAELLSTSYPEYERRIVEQMQRLFHRGGFQPERDIAGIILNRWGHAFSVPYPGFFGGSGDGGAPRDVLRRSYGRIAFAHSELDGMQHWGPAASEGRRAVDQLWEVL